MINFKKVLGLIRVFDYNLDLLIRSNLSLGIVLKSYLGRFQSHFSNWQFSIFFITISIYFRYVCLIFFPFYLCGFFYYFL